jgi:transposase-like protein
MTEIKLSSGPERRRRWSAKERSTILAAAFAPGAVGGGGTHRTLTFLA